MKSLSVELCNLASSPGIVWSMISTVYLTCTTVGEANPAFVLDRDLVKKIRDCQAISCMGSFYVRVVVPGHILHYIGDHCCMPFHPLMRARVGGYVQFCTHVVKKIMNACSFDY